MKISNEVKVGLLIVAALVVLFIGFRIMRDVPVFRQANKVYAVFERASGLGPGNKILVRGVKVGTVQQVQLTDEDSVKVIMSIESEYVIPQGTKAKIESLDLLGTKAIVLERGSGIKEVPYGGRIEGVYEEGMVEKFKAKGDDLSESVSTSIDEVEKLLKKLNKVVSEENQAAIDSVVADIGRTTSQLAMMVDENEEEVGQSISHMRSILQGVDSLSSDNRAEIDSTIASLTQASANLEQFSGDLEVTVTEINEILTKINSGTGTIGQLVNNPSLYHNIDSLSLQLNDLVKDLKDDPRRYLKHMRLVDMF